MMKSTMACGMGTQRSILMKQLAWDEHGNRGDEKGNETAIEMMRG